MAKAAILGLFQIVSTHGNTGLIGKPLAVVQQKSDLFVFFNFAPIGKKTSNGTTVTSFKPTGDAFRPLVTLAVTTGPRDAIQVLRLFVSRSFIDDRKKSIYAADLVKSFLGNAGVSSPADDIARLAREISARAMAGSSAPTKEIAAADDPHFRFMLEAVELAETCQPVEEKIPKVGAIIVSAEGHIIGRGSRGKNCTDDDEHAELRVLESVHERDRPKLEGSILYTTLELCTPDSRSRSEKCCSELIFHSRFPRVFVGIPDPNPDVTGKGFAWSPGCSAFDCLLLQCIQ